MIGRPSVTRPSSLARLMLIGAALTSDMPMMPTYGWGDLSWRHARPWVPNRIGRAARARAHRRVRRRIARASRRRNRP